MPTRVLAKRFAAFQCCQLLHLSGELDDTFQPISKESFWIREEGRLTVTNDETEEIVSRDSLEPRPGTTKRRQYYYKKVNLKINYNVLTIKCLNNFIKKMYVDCRFSNGLSSDGR